LLTIIADQGNENLRVIAGPTHGGQNLIMGTRARASMWRDLESKTIGVTPGTYGRILFFIAAEEGGADLRRVSLRNITVPRAWARPAPSSSPMPRFGVIGPLPWVS
jgi:ABC-type nitrate/sulfonate/bicarbonate transport system substrate-binding protein